MDDYPVVYGSINPLTLRIKSLMSVRSKSHIDFAASTLMGMLTDEHITWRYIPLHELVYCWKPSSEEVRTAITEHVKIKYQKNVSKILDVTKQIDALK